MDPSSLCFAPSARRDPRRCLACGHGMAVHAARRWLCGGWARRGVPAAAVPVVRGAAGVVVGVPAPAAGRGSLPQDLRAAAAVRALRGEPRAVAGVRAGLAAGRGRDDRRGDRPGGWRCLRCAPGRGPGRGTVHDRARLDAPVRRPYPALGIAFGALAVELGGEPVSPAADSGRLALTAVGAAFTAAAALPGWALARAWRFASAVTGGRLIAANVISPFLVVGRRRFMPPVPPLPA